MLTVLQRDTGRERKEESTEKVGLEQTDGWVTLVWDGNLRLVMDV